MKPERYTMGVIEHHIQREILQRLTHAAGLRFTGLKPAGMESNIFMYHLKQLMAQGYVEKVGDAYQLAAPGLSYVDSLSTENHRPRPQPKLIAILALHDGQGGWLLAERKIQPYIGTRMFPSGKQHRGETSMAHATRELYEKTGWQDVPLRHRGIADVQISDTTGTLVTHAVAVIYQGEVGPRPLPPGTDRFTFVWHNFATDVQPLMPGTQEVFTQLGLAGDIESIIAVRMP
jgi:8-oxo-dGTP pyrophosphatase MutT (NUDIX family)